MHHDKRERRTPAPVSCISGPDQQLDSVSARPNKSDLASSMPSALAPPSHPTRRLRWGRASLGYFQPCSYVMRHSGSVSLLRIGISKLASDAPAFGPHLLPKRIAPAVDWSAASVYGICVAASRPAQPDGTLPETRIGCEPHPKRRSESHRLQCQAFANRADRASRFRGRDSEIAALD